MGKTRIKENMDFYFCFYQCFLQSVSPGIEA